MQVKAILSLESIISTGQNGHHYKVYKKKKKMLEMVCSLYTIGGNVNWCNH